MDLLHAQQFFIKTGLLPGNVHFVNEYEDKGVLGQQLEITHLLDDSVKVARIALQSGFTPIVFG